jgi:hypothetical protein
MEYLRFFSTEEVRCLRSAFASNNEKKWVAAARTFSHSALIVSAVLFSDFKTGSTTSSTMWLPIWIHMAYRENEVGTGRRINLRLLH